LLYVFGNKMETGTTQWDPVGMGIRLKLGNANGKEWDLIAWKWEGMRM